LVLDTARFARPWPVTSTRLDAGSALDADDGDQSGT
jgi:hypothetical protein